MSKRLPRPLHLVLDLIVFAGSLLVAVIWAEAHDWSLVRVTLVVAGVVLCGALNIVLGLAFQQPEGPIKGSVPDQGPGRRGLL